MDDTQQIINDLMIYGTSVKIVFTRAWYNPMRWIKGKYHQKRLDPRR